MFGTGVEFSKAAATSILIASLSIIRVRLSGTQCSSSNYLRDMLTSSAGFATSSALWNKAFGIQKWNKAFGIQK